MRKIIIVLLACSWIMTACVKSKGLYSNELFIAATMGNISWVATPSTNVIANTDSVQIQGVKETADGSQNLSIRLKFTGPGTYAITGQQAAYINYVEAASLKYQLDTTQTNNITIATHNVVDGISTGSFQLHFVNAATGNKADFTNGSFWLQMPF
jgi:hypothetical protein